MEMHTKNFSEIIDYRKKLQNSGNNIIEIPNAYHNDSYLQQQTFEEIKKFLGKVEG